MINKFLILFIFFINITINSEEINISNQVSNFKSYKFDPKSSIISRVIEPPDFIINYALKNNIISNYQKFSINNNEKNKINKNINILPKNLKNIFIRNVIGIYFIKNLNRSGLTISIKDENKKYYFIILINSDYLNSNMSDWLSIKENSCFIDNDNNYKIRISIECIYNAYFYILIHELSHALCVINNIIPIEISNTNKFFNETKEEYLKGIWDDYYNPTIENDFELRKDITFYNKNNGPKIKKSDSIELYKELENTSFISLYGSLDCSEDFAELFTMFFLTQKLNLIYKILIYKNDQIVFYYEPIKNEKIKKRFIIIDKYYNIL